MSIERDPRERIVVRRGLPQLRNLPGTLSNAVVLDTGYTWNDLDQKQGPTLQERVDWNLRFWRRHSDTLFAPWFYGKLRLHAEQARLLLIAGHERDGWQKLNLALSGPPEDRARAIQVLEQVVEQGNKWNHPDVDISIELENALNPSSEVIVRRAAADALGSLLLSGHLKSVKPYNLLMTALRDTDGAVSAAAARTLIKLIDQNEVMTQYLVTDRDGALQGVLKAGTMPVDQRSAIAFHEVDPYAEPRLLALLPIERNTLDSFRNQIGEARPRLTDRLQRDFEKVFYDHGELRLTLVNARAISPSSRPPWDCHCSMHRAGMAISSAALRRQRRSVRRHKAILTRLSAVCCPCSRTRTTASVLRRQRRSVRRHKAILTRLSAVCCPCSRT